jgi:hypothetical protein
MASRIAPTSEYEDTSGLSAPVRSGLGSKNSSFVTPVNSRKMKPASFSAVNSSKLPAKPPSKKKSFLSTFSSQGNGEGDSKDDCTSPQQDKFVDRFDDDHLHNVENKRVTWTVGINRDLDAIESARRSAVESLKKAELPTIYSAKSDMASNKIIGGNSSHSYSYSLT